MRDYDFIQSCVDRRSRDPFIFSSSRQLEGKILELELRDTLRHLRQSKGEWEDIAFRDPVYRDNLTRGRLSKEAKIQQALQRLGMAVVGGVFLIGPMWLMVLKKELYTTLITTTAFVFGFGLLMSIVPVFVAGTKIGMEAVLSATAGYAAVLVVFVGKTTPTATSSTRSLAPLNCFLLTLFDTWPETTSSSISKATLGRPL